MDVRLKHDGTIQLIFCWWPFDPIIWFPPITRNVRWMITFNNKFLCRCRRDSETCKRLDVLPKAVMALKLILCFNNQIVRVESIEEVTQFENGPDKWLLGKLCLCSSSIFHNQVAKPRLQFHLDDCHHLHFPKWFYRNFSFLVVI